MGTYSLNTLEQAENLVRCGFQEQQAKGLIEVIALATSNLVTKQDLEQVKLEMRMEIQQECNGLRNEMRHELSELKEESRTELLKFKEETRMEFSRMRELIAGLDKKILTMTISLATVLVVALGAYTSLLQWLLK